MLKRRAPRVLLSGFVMTVAVSGLTACRTSPNVAAYVGDEQVTVTELENAVERRLEDPELAAFAAERAGPEFTRQVLSLMVRAEVHAVAAEQFGVRVDDDDVRRRLQDLLAGSDEDAQYSELAQRGIGRADVFETVRQQLVRQEIAEAEGTADEPTEAELQARYEEVREEVAEVSFGYITVPDEATAAGVLAQLTADPASYPAVAAQYPSPTTLPALQTAGAPTRCRRRWPRASPRRSRTPASPPPSPRSAASSSPSWRARCTPRSRSCVPGSSRSRRGAAGGRRRTGRRRPGGPRRHGQPAVRRPRGGQDRRARPAASWTSSRRAARTRPPTRARRPGTDPVLPALVVTVSSRLPGLLSPAGWRALSGGRRSRRCPVRRPRRTRCGPTAGTSPRCPTSSTWTADVVVLATPDEVPPGAEVVDGAAEPPGARLLDVVAVMDRLRSPGGCPWDAEQTHASLRGYLLEEAHEAYDAIVDDDAHAMREELGDVLLQVVFHARVAAEAAPDRRFDIDDVAGDLVDKLVRRHPHVFGDAGPRDVAQVEAGWEEIKQAEKQRRSPTEGVSRSQPAAAWGCRARAPGGPGGPADPAPAGAHRDQPGGARRAAAVGRDRRRAARLGRGGRPPRGGAPLRRGTGRGRAPQLE